MADGRQRVLKCLKRDRTAVILTFTLVNMEVSDIQAQLHESLPKYLK